jgi:hypothetical protein
LNNRSYKSIKQAEMFSKLTLLKKERRKGRSRRASTIYYPFHFCNLLIFNSIDGSQELTTCLAARLLFIQLKCFEVFGLEQMNA